MFDSVKNTVLTIIGVLGVISLLKGTITIHEDIRALVSVYQNITRPLWEFLIGWWFQLSDIKFPDWLKDYLTMMLISAGAVLRSDSSFYKSFKNGEAAVYRFRIRHLTSIMAHIIFWPLAIISASLLITSTKLISEKGVLEEETIRLLTKAGTSYFHILFWTFITIGISYSLILYDKI